MSQTMKNEANNKFDNSLSFKKSQDQRIGSQREFKNTSKSPNKKQTIQPKVDSLNDWEYCNPENIKDELPQPYRFVDKVLQQMILKEVYNNIFEIEKHKENPNYEGNLKQLPPQGSFEFDGISTMNKSKINPYNQVLAGDKYGNLFLLDLNKKTQIQKKECTPGKRITHIHSQTIPYADQHLTTFCVISRAEPKVYIYRYLSQENRMHQNYFIRLTKDYTNDSKTGEYPYQAQLSQNCEFIYITNYLGDVIIYKIPEPPQPLLETIEENQNILMAPSQQQQSQSQNQKAKLASSINFDKASEEIKQQFYKIKFTGYQKELTYEEMLKKVQEESQAIYKEQVEAQDQQKQQEKVVKKDTKKGGKDIVQDEAKDDEKGLFYFNEDTAFPPYQVKQNNADISDDIAVPKYKVQAFFTYEFIPVQNSKKVFSSVKQLPITTGVYVSWTNTKIIQNHKLQASKPENLQSYLYNLYFNDQQNSNQQENLKKLMPPFEKKLYQQYQIIYQIKVALVNDSSTFLALGLKDGTVLIWDMLLDIEKCYLDKHVKAVTCLGFLENWKLISGSQDGSVHLYNIQKEKLEMKRTNLFKESRPYSIVDIKVCEGGIAFVIDSLNNLRMYDMWHGEKISRMTCAGPLESKVVGWNLLPLVVMDAQKDQLCIVCELKKNNQSQQQQSSEQNQPNTNNSNTNNSWDKQTNIQIFRIFDSLINLFPGLSNVFRKGIDRDKIVNLFSRISMKELKDPSFEIPSIGLQPQGTGSGADNKTISSQKRSQGSKSQNKKSQTQHLQSSAKNQSFAQSQTKGGLRKTRNMNQSELSPQQSMNKQQSQISNDNMSEQDLNSSFKTQITHISNQKQKALHDRKGGLTKELLHPEEYLLDKVKLPSYELVNEMKETIDGSRKRNLDKIQRANKIASNIVKIRQDLQIQEDKRLLKKKQELLKTEH